MKYFMQRLCFCLALFSLFFIKPLWAEADTSLHISAYGGEFWPFQDGYEDAVLVGGRFTFNVLENLEAGVDVSFMHSDDKFRGIKIGKSQEIPVLMILKYNFNDTQEEMNLVPYIIGGVGARYLNFDKEFDTVSAKDKFNFAATAGIGFDLMLTGNMSLFAEGNYFWSRYRIKGTVENVDVDLTPRRDGVIAKGGIRFSF